MGLWEHAWSTYRSNIIQSCQFYLQGGPKNGLFLRVDIFATVNERKASDKSKVSEFCPEKA